MALEIPNAIAAAADALARLNSPPQKTPKARPLANVIRNAGRGATRAWRIISRPEITGAQTPNERM